MNSAQAWLCFENGRTERQARLLRLSNDQGRSDVTDIEKPIPMQEVSVWSGGGPDANVSSIIR